MVDVAAVAVAVTRGETSVGVVLPPLLLLLLLLVVVVSLLSEVMMIRTAVVRRSFGNHDAYYVGTYYRGRFEGGGGYNFYC